MLKFSALRRFAIVFASFAVVSSAVEVQSVRAASSPDAPLPLPLGVSHGFPVTISGDSVPSLIEQLSTQSHMQFSFASREGRPNPPISLALKDVPLWDAVRQIQNLTQPDGTVLWKYGPQPFTFQTGDPFSHAGPFLIRVNGIYHNVDYGRPDAAAEIYYVNIFAFTDPSARIVSINHASNPTRAVDDAGNSLVPEAPAPDDIEMVPERGGGGRNFTESVRILLRRPKGSAKSGHQMKLLEGVIPAAVATRIDTLELGFPSIEERMYGAIHAKISCNSPAGRGASPVAGTLETDITFTRPIDMQDDKEWARISAALSGTRVRYNGATTQGGGESGTATSRSITVIFPKPPAGDTEPKVVIEIPAGFETVNIPYHFENLPLP